MNRENYIKDKQGRQVYLIHTYDYKTNQQTFYRTDVFELHLDKIVEAHPASNAWAARINHLKMIRLYQAIVDNNSTSRYPRPRPRKTCCQCGNPMRGWLIKYCSTCGHRLCQNCK